MNDQERKTALDNGYRARVLMEQGMLWSLAEVFRAAVDGRPDIDFSVPLPAVELVDVIAELIGDRNITLADLAALWGAQEAAS